jgi:dolichyl-phosphate-mannose--protein O-mannosyl transferase
MILGGLLCALSQFRFCFCSTVFTQLFALSAADENAVTCGSVIKIQQTDTSYFLNSETKNLNAGSGQQIVTFVSDTATHNTLWWVRPADHATPSSEYPAGATCQLAEPIECGSLIRLTHQSTRRNLHSHKVESVLSKQQEVTAFGQGDGLGDGGDDWRVVCREKYWMRGAPVRLQHKDTGFFLGTAKSLEFNRETCGSHCPIMNHLEGFARKEEDSHSLLKTEMGIHISK